MYTFHSISISWQKCGLRSQLQRNFFIIIYQISSMIENSKNLLQIITNKPNLVTGFRMVLNLAAVSLFNQYSVLSAAFILLSTILDYFDGVVARKYQQCTFFGEIFDWLADITSYAVVLFWFIQVLPTYSLFFFSLLCFQIFVMVTDIISKCFGFHPRLDSNSWGTFMLKYTMNIDKRGYSSVGIGYWNQLLHFTCLLAGVLYFSSGEAVWFWIFVGNIPMSISYVWMHYGYTLCILQSWIQQIVDQKIKLRFIEQ